MLWFVAAVSALAIAFLRLATGDRYLIAAQVDAIQARALTQEGLTRTVLFVNGRTGKPLPRSLTWALPEGAVTARVTSEAGKVDLNAADPTLLDALARAVGIAPAVADQIGDAIADWRDNDDLRLPHGAEKRDYSAAGRTYGPANKPFRQLEELRYVLPIDNAAFARMAPYLTLYSGKPEPDAQLAPRIVRAAMDLQRGLKPQDERNPTGATVGAGTATPAGSGTGAAAGSSPPDQTSLAAGTTTPAGPSSTPQPSATPSGEGVPSQAGSVYSIDLDVRLSAGYESHARVVVALAGQGGGPALRVLDWAVALPAPAEP